MVRQKPSIALIRSILRPQAGRYGVLALLTVVFSVFSTHALAWSWADAMFGVSKPAKQPIADWSYEGDTAPAHWGELAPEYAACNGSRQSPVDLRGARPMPYSPISFHYRSNPLNIVNDGRQILVRYKPGSYMIANGRRYELTDFHFHLPGEHRIEGVAADMELQLHHRDARGRLAIVAVPIKAGRRRNSTLSRILDHMPPVGGESYYGRQVGINALFLLPPKRDYFSYVGSLTEPPCTEGVEWFVLVRPLELDTGYLQRVGQVIGGNARPLQPLNGRPVLAAMRR